MPGTFVAAPPPVLPAARKPARPDAFVRSSGKGIGVNHILHVVDAGTAAALGDPQGFLATHFASVRTQEGNDGRGHRWLGTYITGKRGYIEIFDPTVLKGDFIHAQSGLLLGTDTSPSFEMLRRELVAIKDPRFSVRADFFPGSARPGLPQVEWIRYVELSPPVRDVFCWLMAYGEDYMSQRDGPPKPGEPVDISRERYNAGTYNPDRYLEDITGIAVKLGTNELAALDALANKCGFTRTQVGDDVIFTNDQLRIRVTVSEAHDSGVTAITMSLNDNARRDRTTIADTTRAFGKATLHIDGDRASATLTLPLKGS